MPTEPWQAAAAAVIVAVCLAFAARLMLGWLALWRLRRLARHGSAIARCWDLIAALPAGLVTDDLRQGIARLLRGHLARVGCRAVKRQPYLRAQGLQIARFAGARGRAAARPARVTSGTLEALQELQSLFDDALHSRLLSTTEHVRASNTLEMMISAVKTELLQQRATRAAHLHRYTEAADQLQAAIDQARSVPGAGATQRDLAHRLAALKTSASASIRQ